MFRYHFDVNDLTILLKQKYNAYIFTKINL